MTNASNSIDIDVDHYDKILERNHESFEFASVKTEHEDVMYEAKREVIESTSSSMMASTSNQAFRSDSELVDYLTTLESEEECSDDNYIFGESSDSDSDDIVTESVTVPSQSTPKRSRIDACAPLFQWTDNEYMPQIHEFDDTNAGITPGMFTDEST
ncbi:hypothetical protein C0J52_16659 [Blattella germanica]|nr:hypothetical protein C0J52_16659 [Blattella germanica]